MLEETFYRQWVQYFLTGEISTRVRAELGQMVFCLNLPQLNHDLGPVAGFLDYPFCVAQNGQLWKETVQIPSGPFRQIDLCISELRWIIQDIDSI